MSPPPRTAWSPHASTSRNTPSSPSGPEDPSGRLPRGLDTGQLYPATPSDDPPTAQLGRIAGRAGIANRPPVDWISRATWVRNLRAAEQGIIRRGRHEEPVVAIELSREEAAQVMQSALAPFLASRAAASLLQRWYDLGPDSTSADYLEEARHHAVFELRVAGR